LKKSDSHSEKRERLRELVTLQIAEKPHSFDGYDWAAKRQDWYADHLGVCTNTVRRITAEPPFVRQRRRVGNQTITLLREGEATPPKTHRHVANAMAKYWKSRFGRIVTRREYGCLIGLAEVWPEGLQSEIFKRSVNHWPDVMTGVKMVNDFLSEEFQMERFYNYPSIALIRKFYEVALINFDGYVQSQGVKLSPEQMDALNSAVSDIDHTLHSLFGG
jgi:hypothetical protein